MSEAILHCSSTLSVRGKRWHMPETLPLGQVNLIEDLARVRGIGVGAEPRLAPPSVFPDMARAVERIERAIAENQRIAIFGDYDCDGITAVTQLARFFHRRKKDPLLVLPHRVHDGYGLQGATVDRLASSGAKLIITCDTGIGAVEEIAQLQAKGIDVIVTDHHHRGEELPPAYAIIHPALSAHPKPYPSGAGVVLKLLHALEKGSWDGMDEDHALAMIGTVADLVELRGDNRALVQLGLHAITHLRPGPLQILIDRVKSTGQTLSSTDVAFRIAPRINAAGRMDSPDIALRALLYGGEDIELLDRLNARRQEQTEHLLREIVQGVDAQNSNFIACASQEYPHGILGLLAGKLTETFGRPSLVATIEGDLCTASLRSPACYHVTEGLSRCKNLLLRFGGHAQAAGCTFSAGNLPVVQQALEDDVKTQVSAEALVPTLTVDAVLDPAVLSLHFMQDIARLEPFGQGNPEPRFLLERATITSPKAVGSNGAHLQGAIGGTSCIGFHLGAFANACTQMDMVVRIGMNVWNGRVRPQIVVEDMRKA